MTHAPFVHLHLHSGFSLLSSTIRIEALVARADKAGMPALALTDQGNLFAAIQFFSACVKAGIKPILGAQVYVVADHKDTSVRADKEVRDQLILLCRDIQGWQNLMTLVSIGHLEGSHDKPRLDLPLLAQYNRGLLALSAGVKGQVGRNLAAGNVDEARAAATRLANIYQDPTDVTPGFYLELQRHGLPNEAVLIRETVDLAFELNLPLVATNDVHFMDRADQRAHDALLCVGQGHTIYDENRHRFNDSYHFASAQEMAELFADIPEALDNTIQIAKRCSLKLDLGRTVLPDFHLPQGEDLSAWLIRQAEEGLTLRLQNYVFPRFSSEDRQAVEKQYRERLAFELAVILQMGFPGYFLIVSDFIRWAKKNAIPVGPGRGSGAGSLVAWSLDITDLDPIRYQLLFERFLNPERVSMPDFDVDFCMDRREEVIRYVQDKYGHDRVAQIITFGTLQARVVIRDVGRILEFPYGRVDRIAKLVPNILGITLKDAIAQEKRFGELVQAEPEVQDLLDLALALEGLPRSAGTHAAGVVMSNGPLTSMVPLYRDPRSNMPVTQFNMADVEKAGLVKFDFLGLKTLTVIFETMKLVNHSQEQQGLASLDINQIELDDPKTFKLLKDGQTRGVFQLESSGMREILKKLAPDTFEDIIALVALYRPGPLGSGMVDDFINCKHKLKVVEYPLPQLESILKETYGVILYQEQVMKIAQVLAGYTLGGADLLRRAMGKKKAEEMASQRDIFMSGAARSGIDGEKSRYIFDLMEKFAGYGFNKSHSAAYALISYQTAWLKAHYPVEFMAATLTCDMFNTDKVVQFIRECKAMGLKLLPPNVNHSRGSFTVEDGGIRFGLAAIKNVGEAAVEAMLAIRDRVGGFRSLFDLCNSCATIGLNRRMLENFIKAGACDPFSTNRAALLAGLSDALSQGSKRREDVDLGFLDLFGEESAPPALPLVAELSEDEALFFEKEAVGFYITGHPLRKYSDELADYGILSAIHIKEKFGRGMDSQEDVRVAGMVTDLKNHRTKKGDRMAFVTLEDMGGQVEVIVFADVYFSCRDLLEGDSLLVVTGRVEPGEEVPKLMAEEVEALATYREKMCSELRLKLNTQMAKPDILDDLSALLIKYSGGTCRVVVTLELEMANVLLGLGENFQVKPKEALFQELTRLLGSDVVAFSSRSSLRN